MSALEAIVNAWMESEHPRIRHVCQSIRGEHILLSFVYEEAHEIEQRISAGHTRIGAASVCTNTDFDGFAEVF